MEGVSVDSGSVVFDRYRLDEQIGAGGMGVVWRATDLLLDQTVALKQVCLAVTDDQQARRARDRALREARLAAQLRHHRHVVAVYDVRVDDGEVWLVLEHLSAQSLAQILRENGSLDPGQAARIGAQVADALAAAHALGIEHRDVTPGNVLLTDDGVAKITDFGISHVAGDTPVTQTGAVSGTLAYLAPEVARTGKSSPASDVFSLGATLYTAIEGQPPFGVADNAVQQLRVNGVGIIIPPTATGAFTPLLLRLLALDPAIRPDAATARDQLDEFATREHDATPHQQATPQPPGLWLRRHPVLTVVLALIIIAVLAGGTTFVLIDHGGNVTAAGVLAMPPRVGPIALTGDPKAADPCALMDPAPLRQFGRPKMDVGDVLAACKADIVTPGDDIYLTVTFDTRGEGDPLGRLQQLDGLSIFHEPSRPDPGMEMICENTLVLADGTRIHIKANSGKAPNACAVTEVGTAVAVNVLAREGIPYRPGRNAGLQIAGSDACKVLDAATLRRVAGVDPSFLEPGFAYWSCTWGHQGTGNPTVSVEFRRDNGEVGREAYGKPISFPGSRAWLSPPEPQECSVVVLHRPALTLTAVNELFRVYVDDPASSQQQRCDRATELAKTVEKNLPTPS